MATHRRFGHTWPILALLGACGVALLLFTGCASALETARHGLEQARDQGLITQEQFDKAMEVLTKVLSSSGWNRFFELAGTGVATILGYVGVDRLRWGPPQKPST